MNVDERFSREDFGVMRHAYCPNGVISPGEDEVCRGVARRLAEKIANLQPVRVLHSPLNRAFLTAQIVVSELENNGLAVVGMESRKFLECETFGLSYHTIVSEISGEGFTLFVSHQPDIERFLRQYYGVSNCSVFSRNFKIHR